jgi:sarcosine oxidase
VSYDAIVVGVGAMGSATLAELAARGARVLGLERASVPNDQGSSGGVTRIIRLAYAEDPRYVPLLHDAYARWRALEARVGERLLHITGGLDAGDVDSASVQGSLEACRVHDLPHEWLAGSEVRRRFPGLRIDDEMGAVYQPDAGVLLSGRAVAGLAAIAIEDGATIHAHEPVLAWHADDGGVTVTTDRAVYRARRLIVSAGAWLGALVPELRPLAVPERQVLIWTQPRVPTHYALGAFPIVVLDVPEGRFYGFPVHAVPGFKLGLYHHRSQVVDPDAWRRDAVDAADEEVLRRGLRAYLPDADGPTLALRTCLFTNTPDEHFILDSLPGMPQVVIASPCSGHGFKFAPVVGSIVADLALEGATGREIGMFGLRRFASSAAGPGGGS